jgi:hypothetical protein
VALVVTSVKQLSPSPEDLDPDELLPWRCHGHPRLEFPGQFDGIELPANLDWDDLVTANLAAVGTPPLNASVDNLPGFLLVRVYLALSDASLRDRLSAAIGARASSSDRKARTGVSLFFAMNPRAEGLDALVAAWKRAPALYDHEPSPWPNEPTLRDLNLKAVVARLRIRRKLGQAHADDLSTLHWAALTAPGLGSYTHALGAIDPLWAASHFEELLAVEPGNWGALFWAVRVSFDVLVNASRWLLASGHASVGRLLSIIGAKYPDWVGRAEQELTRL